VKLDNKNKRNQSRQQDKPANSKNSEKTAPQTYQQSNDEKDYAQNQAQQSYIFSSLGRYLHSLFPALYFEQNNYKHSISLMCIQGLYKSMAM
jgi:hypothetical protein